MSNSVLLDAIRNCMAGLLPATPDATKNVMEEEETGWAAQVLRQRPRRSSSSSTASGEAGSGALAASLSAEPVCYEPPVTGEDAKGELASSLVAKFF